MVKMVIINGTGGSGKDTFVDFCMNNVANKTGHFIYNVSSVDKIKEAATIIGWNGSKEEKDRKFLSDFKALVKDYNDGNYTYIINRYKEVLSEDNYDGFKGLMFVHVREVDEIKRIKESIGDNCVTLLITNNRVKEITSNVSDRDVLLYDYEYIIRNDGSLDDLENETKRFIIDILGEE